MSIYLSSEQITIESADVMRAGLSKQIDIEAFDRHYMGTQVALGYHSLKNGIDGYDSNAVSFYDPEWQKALAQHVSTSVTQQFDMFTDKSIVDNEHGNDLEWAIKTIDDIFGSDLRFFVAKSVVKAGNIIDSSGIVHGYSTVERRTFAGFEHTGDKARPKDVLHVLSGHELHPGDRRVTTLAPTSHSIYSFKTGSISYESDFELDQ